MLKLTDDELTHLFQAAAPIAIERRDDFPEAVAAILTRLRRSDRSGHRSSGNRRRSGSTSIRRQTTALQAARDGTATRLGSRRSASRRRAEGRSPDTETNFATQRSVVACRRMPVPVSLVEPHVAAPGLLVRLRRVGNEARRSFLKWASARSLMSSVNVRLRKLLRQHISSGPGARINARLVILRIVDANVLTLRRVYARAACSEANASVRL